MNLNLKPFFTSKKIVISRTHRPAELVRYFTVGKKKYARVAFTNTINDGRVPITDIAFEDIAGVREFPTPFKAFCCKLVGIKPRATFYKFKSNLK